MRYSATESITTNNDKVGWDYETCKKYPDLAKRYCTPEKLNTLTDTTPDPHSSVDKKADSEVDPIHDKCLKAADYQGCMKYNSKSTGKPAKSGSK
jgi:hypothetical protein